MMKFDVADKAVQELEELKDNQCGKFINEIIFSVSEKNIAKPPSQALLQSSVI